MQGLFNCGQLEINTIRFICARISTYLPDPEMPSAKLSPPCGVTGTFMKKLMFDAMSRLINAPCGSLAIAVMKLSRQLCIGRFSNA